MYGTRLSRVISSFLDGKCSRLFFFDGGAAPASQVDCSTGFWADKMTVSIPISTKLGVLKEQKGKVGLHNLNLVGERWRKVFLFTMREAGLNIAMSHGLYILQE